MQPPEALVNDRAATIRWGLLLWGIALAIYVVIAIPALRDLVEPVDEWFWDLAIRFEWAPAVAVAKVLRIIGSAWVMVPFDIVVGLWLIKQRRWHTLVFWAGAIAVLQATVWISKAIYQEPRPPDPLASTDSYSFPSGHSATAAVVSVALVLVFASAHQKRRQWFLAAAAWTILMMAGRVYLRAHWLTDVVAGATLGAAIALSAGLLVDRWSGPTGKRQPESSKQ